MQVVCPLIGGRNRMSTQHAGRRSVVLRSRFVSPPSFASYLRAAVTKQTHHHLLARTFSGVRYPYSRFNTPRR